MKKIIASVLTLALVACGGDKEAEAAKPAEAAPAKMEEKAAEVQAEASKKELTLADVIANERRGDAAKRDEFRNPAETLAFFGLESDMTVVEIWPGGGWYADIIAPYLASGGGTYYAAGFDPEGASERGLARIAAFEEKFVNNADVYGDVKVTAFSGTSGAVAPEGSADMVLTFRNVHNWMGSPTADKAFTDFYAALKPGGVLGVVEHRLPADREQDPEARNGYVSEATVIAMAERAGFELAERSEINANPKDTADHPRGVWTLPPVSSVDKEDPDFDAEKYLAIGESDRMTLKFRKPITADGALLE